MQPTIEYLDEYMSVEEMAKRLTDGGVFTTEHNANKSIQAWCRRGTLTAVKIMPGRATELHAQNKAPWGIPRQEAEKFIAAKIALHETRR